MSQIIQARIDDELSKKLEILKQNGYSEAAAVREGLIILAALIIKKEKKDRVIGIGAFESNISDLGSNKKPLKGFGK